MPDIASIGHGQVGPIDRTSSATGARRDVVDVGNGGAPAPPERPGDRVELSDHARFLDHLRHLPDVRHDRVQEVRAAIHDGSYETDEKLDVAINRLFSAIFDLVEGIGCIHFQTSRVITGAGFLLVLTGSILTMPGLGKVPAAEAIDVDAEGRIEGLF